MQRMHIVSVCLHVGNIVWLLWQRPLTNLSIKVQIYFLHVMRSHMVERLQKSVQYIQGYSTKYASFLAVIPDVHK